MFAFYWWQNTGVFYYLYLIGLLCAIALLAAAVYYFALHIKKARVTYLESHGAKADPLAESIVKERTRRFVGAEEMEQNALDWSEAANVKDPVKGNSPSDAEAGLSLGKGKTILIADDDHVVVFALSRRLQQLGFQVIPSPDAAHALMGAMKIKPDLDYPRREYAFRQRIGGMRNDGVRSALCRDPGHYS